MLKGVISIVLAVSAWCMAAGAQPSFAQDAAWRIVKWNGDVRAVSPRGETIAPLDQAVLPPGTKVATGPGSRAMMARGADTVVMAENSSLVIPTATTPGVTPSIVQNRGTVSFDIEPRPVQHFMIETPHLGAVVKGTSFTVSMAQGVSKVEVSRGAVEVQDFRSGQSALVESKRWASSSPSNPPRLVVGGDGWLPVIKQGATRKASMAVDEEAPSAPAAAVMPAAPEGAAAKVAAAKVGTGTDGEVTRTIAKERGWVQRITDPNDDDYMFGVMFAGFTGFFVTVLFAIRNRRRIEQARDRSRP